MPAAIPLVAAAAGAAVAGSTLAIAAFGTFGASLVGGLASFAVNAVGSRALAKKPKSSPGASIDSGLKQVVRLSDATQRIVYGRARLGGVLIYAATSDSGFARDGSIVTGTNKFLHLVVALTGHEVEDIGLIHLNDDLVTLDANGWATSAPYTDSTSTSTLRMIGILAANRSANVVRITTTAPHGLLPGDTVSIDNKTGFTGGPYVVTQTPTPTMFMYDQVGGDLNRPAGGAVYTTSATASFKSYVRVTKLMGSANQAANLQMMQECPGWTSNHRLRGISALYVRLEWNPDVFPTGIPTINATVQGKKVYDPRTGLTQWSENSALCIRDYLTSRDGAGVPYGFGLSDAEVDDAYTIASANICEEVEQVSTGGLQFRYTCNGAVDTANGLVDNLQALVTSLAGAVTCPRGKFRIHAGAFDFYETHTVIDESWLAGPLESQNRIPRQELFNAVRGTFISEAAGFVVTDFPPITSELYEQQDNGERIFTDIELPFTKDGEAAQRIAKIILRKCREQITVTMPVNYKGLQLAVWDVVRVNNAKRGWNEKLFRIENLSFDLQGGIVLQLKEENPESYVWSVTDAVAEAKAPDTNLPSAFTVAPPNALAVAEERYVTRDGSGVKVLARMDWLASSDAFLHQYQPEYKPKGSTAWNLLPRTESTTAEVLDVEPGIYDFRVKAMNRLGVSSAYSTASRQIAGLSDPPAEPQNLTVSTIGGLAVLRWGQSADIDVRIGGRFIVRHSPDAGVTWNQTTSIGDAVPGSHTSVVLPLKPGSYLMKAVDSLGIESVSFAVVATSQATALAYANVDALTEHPGFTGAKTGVYLDGSALKLSGAGQFDGIPDFDAVPDLDADGGSNLSGSYEFSGVMDLGSLKKVRLTSHVQATVTQAFDTIDSRSTSIDDWLSFDGDNAAAGDSVVYVEVTDDDPGGSPTWRSRQRLDSGEFEARAFRFTLDMAVDDPTYNIAVTQLEVTAAEVA